MGTRGRAHRVGEGPAWCCSSGRRNFRVARKINSEKSTLMKVMIIGGTGLLGKALTQEWSGDEVVGLGSRDVDIRHADKVREVVERYRPDWIVLAAAFTNVDDCESHPELAFAVNREGAVNVAQAAKHSGAKLFFLSSD